MKQPVFQGAGTAIITPFAGSAVDYGRLEQQLDFQLEHGIDAIIVCGTTGESSTMTFEEQKKTIAHCVKHVSGRCTVIGGTGGNNTAAVLEKSKSAAGDGVDALLLVTPYYNKCTQNGLVEHYTYIADRVDVPVIVYNVPSRTGVNVSEASYIAMSRHPNINGVKEASGETAKVARTVAACGENFHVWSGNDDQIVPLMALGAKGVISVLSNICPAETVAMAKACLADDYEMARSLQLRYMGLIDALFCEVNPIPVKAAMELLGMDSGQLRMPLSIMEPQNVQKLRTAMSRVGLL